MRKFFISFIVSIMLIAVGLIVPREIQAVCSSQGDCAYRCNAANCATPQSCTYDCEVVYPATTGSCYSSCGGGGGCDVWSGWGPCGGGWQERYCTSPADDTSMQLRSCTTSSTPSPGPTDPPVCNPTTPTAVLLTSPGNGSNVTTLQPDLDWAGTTNWGTGCPTNNNRYSVYIGTTNPPTTLLDTTTATILQFPDAQPATTYYWRVLTLNGSNSVYSATWSFTTQAAISGTVFLSNDNTCSSTASTLSGLSARVRGTGYLSAVSTTNGTYSITAPVGSYSNLDLLGVPSTYSCATGCLQSCPTISTVASQSINNNFYLTTQVDSWWQAAGASIYAGSTGAGVTVKSQLPSASSDLILPDSSGKSGALLRGSGAASLGLGSVSNDLWSTISRYRGKKMDYSYFSAQMGVLKNQASDWSTDVLDQKPYESRDFWYTTPSSGTATVSAPWTIANGQKYVVFVNGNLRIANNITVANGGFVSFVVNGNISVAPNVTTLQGVYIGNNFTTESQYVSGVTNDSQLNVGGTVVAWGTMSLGRNLGVNNAANAAEKFTYRPDLLVSMPDKMKVFAMQWQEVVPGTIE